MCERGNVPELFYEANFDLLPSQSSIYGVTCISSIDECTNKILVALTKGRIFACEATNSDIKRVNREVTFTYIPGKCHIISIDNFSCAARGLIVGVTFCKESTENFFNVYCNYGDDVPTGQEWNLDNVAQNCRSFDLGFTPYQLTHCKVRCPVDGEQRTVFILLGGDKSFHVYAQQKDEVEFAKEPVQDYFSELETVFDVPTYLDINNIDETKRVSVIGYESGDIHAFLVDSTYNSVVKSWTIAHDSPISQCQLFQNSRPVYNKRDFLTSPQDPFHLIVISAREPSMLYRNVLEKGFSDPVILAESASFDCVSCCAVADINYDDKNEILVGTYGQKILAYSCDTTCRAYTYLKPIWTRNFAYPILKIEFTDISGDGVNEMAVISTKGVHILQSDLNFILKKCKSKLMKQLQCNPDKD